MSKEHTFVIYSKRLPESAARAAITVGTFASMIGLGVFLESPAMQWVGGIFWILYIFGWASSHTDKSRVHSIAAARKRLDEIEAELNV